MTSSSPYTGGQARGLNTTDVAAELFVSAHTVRDHIKSIFAKLGVSSRGELVAKIFADHYGPVLYRLDPHVDMHESSDGTE
jgi:hypothetical protein